MFLEGTFNKTGAYAIFKSQYDFTNKRNPCDHYGNVFVFNNDGYIGVVLILESELIFNIF